MKSQSQNSNKQVSNEASFTQSQNIPILSTTPTIAKQENSEDNMDCSNLHKDSSERNTKKRKKRSYIYEFYQEVEGKGYQCISCKEVGKEWISKNGTNHLIYHQRVEHKNIQLKLKRR